MTHNASSPSLPRRATSGFTLPEVLLASVLGAMLLSALTVGTFGFTLNLSHLEAKAGINTDVDPVLRVLTRDIREAWWAESVNASHIKLSDPVGNVTEYFLDNHSDLILRRDNGDEGMLLENVEALSFAPSMGDRYREGEPATFDGTWYQSPTTSSPAVAIPLPVGGAMGIGFVGPAMDIDIPGGSDGGEHVFGVDVDVLRAPIAWIPGTNPEELSVAVYESWAPGSAKPLGSPVASLNVPGSSLPAAVWNEDDSAWELPATVVSIGLSLIDVDVQPGVGYTAVLSASGNAQLLVKAHPFLGSSSVDDIAVQPAGGEFAAMPMIVPFSVAGPYSKTNTIVTPVVTMFSIELTPDGRPTQTRSAALLSQRISEDPWLGVVPGETADF